MVNEGRKGRERRGGQNGGRRGGERRGVAHRFGFWIH